MAKDARVMAPDRLETDICIVGSGPAGVTLARELIDKGMKILLLESGGAAFDPEVQALADGHISGGPIVRPIIANRRQLGGGANLWNVNFRDDDIGLRLAPFDKIDFEQRHWVPDSGWPFDHHHLAPYYERAQVVTQAGPFRYQGAAWEGNQRRQLPLDDQVFKSQVFQFGPAAAFHNQYLNELKAAQNIEVICHATAVELRTNASGLRVEELRVACLNGKTFSVAAKMFVLACGAFENARLLLLSNGQQAAGLGNAHDVVGRYYHDHPEVISGHFVPYDQNFFNTIAFYDIRSIDSKAVMGFLRLSDGILRRERLLNASTILLPRISQRGVDAIQGARHIRDKIKSDPLGATREIWKVVRGLDVIGRAIYYAKAKNQTLHPHLARDGWRDASDNGRIFQRLEVRHGLEQTPLASNRVTLSAERDALGANKLHLHSSWQKMDAVQFARYIKLLATALKTSGLGELQPILDGDGLPEPVTPIGSHHMMGTTRMHNDPRKGVVDVNCCVHGIDNLFMAGGSVFPTGGYANPTLTIVAMSLRLSDFIISKYRRETISA